MPLPVDKPVGISSAERIAGLCWWYLALLMATSVAKFEYLDRVYARNVGSALTEIIVSTGTTAPSWFVVLLILTRDILQTGCLALGMFLLTLCVPRTYEKIVYRIGSCMAVLILVANHRAFAELGTFLSIDVLATSWAWVTHQPAVLRTYASMGTAYVLAAMAVWVMLPSLCVQAAHRNRVLGALQRGLPWSLCALLAASLLLRPIASARFGERAFPLHAYWGSLVEAGLAAKPNSPLARQVPSQARLIADFRKLTSAPDDKPQLPLRFPDLESRIRPRHVLIVGLETAPKAFYPLTSSNDLPTFRAMTERALVSERHYTTSPYTRMANFSILSGVYAPPSGLPVRFGPIADDGLASVLRAHGYETTYIDSWVLDWLKGSGERAQAHMLGFDTVIDSQVRRDDGVYEVLVHAEEVAFDKALARIVQADTRGRKAAVFIGTMLGHAPWPAPLGSERLDARERLHNITKVLDGLFGKLLSGLAAHGLTDDVLIVVVGDHGLRLADEFESLDLHYTHSDLAFNVPFLLYAPGLLDHTLRISYATSHIDITPTLLHLVGVSTAGLLHDGSYMLDGRLADRTVFLSCSKLGPIDGYTWQGHHVTYHSLSGSAQVGLGADAASMRSMKLAPETLTLPPPLRDPASLLDAFEQHTDCVAATFLKRGRTQAHPEHQAATLAIKPR